MAPQTVSNAVATREDDKSPKALVAAYTEDFRSVLPRHLPASTFVRLGQGVLTKNPDVRQAAEANPWSLIHALLECARLGHEPGTDQFALTKFNNKNAPGGMEVVGIEQYQGEIERMYRAGAIESIHAEVVYDFELSGNARPGLKPFRYEVGMAQPDHEPDWFHSERGKEPRAVAVYAFARMAGGGTSRPVVMPRSEVMLHRAAAKTTKFWDGPFWKSMWLKTAVHELEKWVPTSAEYRRELARAAAAAEDARAKIPAAAAPQPAAPRPPVSPQEDVYEGDIVEPDDADWPAPAQPGGA